MSITSSGAEYGFIYYENNSSDITLSESTTFNKLENYVLMEPFSGNTANVEVGPGEDKIVVM
jgi:hypothetical protein